MTDSESNKVWIHLYGGEQDGFRRKIEIRTRRPKRFYVWHVNDGATIDAASGRDQMVLRSKLATMAYEWFDEIDDGGDGLKEHRYRRLEAADKVVADPAV